MEMDYLEELMFDKVVELGVATSAELGLVKAIHGGRWVDIINSVVYVRTGYATLESLLEGFDEEEEEETTDFSSSLDSSVAVVICFTGC